MQNFNIEEDWVDMAPNTNSQVDLKEKESKNMEDTIRKSLSGMGNQQKLEQFSQGNFMATSMLTVKEPSSPVTRFLPKEEAKPEEIHAEPVDSSSEEEFEEKSDENIQEKVEQDKEITHEAKEKEEEKEETKEILKKEEEKEEEMNEERSSFGSMLNSSILSPENRPLVDKAWNLSHSIIPSDEALKFEEEAPEKVEEKIEKQEEKIEKETIEKETIETAPRTEEKEEKKIEKVEEEIEVAKEKEEKTSEKLANEYLKRIEKVEAQNEAFKDLRNNGVTALPHRDMELYIITGSLLTMVVHSFFFSPACAAF